MAKDLLTGGSCIGIICLKQEYGARPQGGAEDRAGNAADASDGNCRAEPSFAHCRPCVCNGTVCQFSETEIEGVNDDSCREE